MLRALLLALPRARSCSTAADCEAACQAAGGNLCDSRSCYGGYDRCVCDATSVLLNDGGCRTPTPRLSTPCSGVYKLTAIVFTHPGPELQDGDTELSAPMQLVFQYGAAAALGLDASRVEYRASFIVPDTLAVDLSQLGGGNSEFLNLDVSFEFCTRTAEELGAIQASTKMSLDFSNALLRYAILSSATVQLVDIQYMSGESEDSRATPSPPPDTTSESASEPVPDAFELYWWLVALLALVFLVVVAALLYKLQLVKREAKDAIQALALNPPPRESPIGPQPEVLPRVRVIHAYEPEQSEDYRSCMLLIAGEEMEVLMHVDEWLYGRSVSDHHREGYFPESHVAWVGRAVADPEPATIGVPQAEPAMLDVTDELALADVQTEAWPSPTKQSPSDRAELRLAALPKATSGFSFGDGDAPAQPSGVSPGASRNVTPRSAPSVGAASFGAGQSQPPSLGESQPPGVVLGTPPGTLVQSPSFG